MKYSLMIFVLLCVFALSIGCSGGNNASNLSSEERTDMRKREEAGNAAVTFFKQKRQKDFDTFYHDALCQSIVVMALRGVPEHDRGQVEKDLFNAFKERAHRDPAFAWQDWPQILDGAIIEAIAYRRVYTVYRLEDIPGVPDRDMVEISKEAYKVSLQFTFTKRSSTAGLAQFPFKTWVVEVPVYFDGHRYLIDGKIGEDHMLLISHDYWM